MKPQKEVLPFSITGNNFQIGGDLLEQKKRGGDSQAYIALYDKITS